jgi:hypothetical protein
MFSALGIGGGGSLIGGIATVLAIIPFLFYKYGKGIRTRSKFAPTNSQDEHKEKDEERDPTTYTTEQLRRPDDAHLAEQDERNTSSDETLH